MADGYYVYIWFRRNGIPCYVGKGNGGRWRDHIRNARNRHLANIFRLADADLPVVIVRDHMIESEAFELEKALILAIGRKGTGGPLVNMTDGGEGVSGYRHTALTRSSLGAKSKIMWGAPDKREQIISAQNMGRSTVEYKEKRKVISAGISNRTDVRESIRAKALKRFSDPAERQRTSDATRRGMADQTARANHSLGQKRRFQRPEELERLSATRLGKKHTEQTRIKIAEANRGKKQSAESRAKISAWQIGRKMSDDARAKMSVAAKKRCVGAVAKSALSERGKKGAAARWKKTIA